MAPPRGRWFPPADIGFPFFPPRPGVFFFFCPPPWGFFQKGGLFFKPGLSFFSCAPRVFPPRFPPQSSQISPRGFPRPKNFAPRCPSSAFSWPQKSFFVYSWAPRFWPSGPRDHSRQSHKRRAIPAITFSHVIFRHIPSGPCPSVHPGESNWDTANTISIRIRPSR